MSEKIDKKLRKEVRKYRRHIMEEFLTAPFYDRLRIALLIVKGKKRVNRPT